MSRIPSLETFRNLDYEPDWKLFKVRAKYNVQFYQCMMEDCGREFTGGIKPRLDSDGKLSGKVDTVHCCPFCGSVYYMWKGCE